MIIKFFLKQSIGAFDKFMTTQFMTTRETAKFLGVNDKMVYTLIAEKGLPATKNTGKWLFPKHLVVQWLENGTINFPKSPFSLPKKQGLVVIAGSNDLLLDSAMSLFNSKSDSHIAVFGNMGSMGGLRALRRNICDIASCHLLEDDGEEYNFEFVDHELETAPAAVNFCKREQGIVLPRGNPKKINSIKDLGKKGVRIVNRPIDTGTRLLFDRELQKAGLKGSSIKGYDKELSKHLDVGLEILTGRADAGPAIRSTASLLGLEFLPIRWERFDLMVSKDKFFDEGIQRFLGLFLEDDFRNLAKNYAGYDITTCGKMIYPQTPDEQLR